MEAVRIHPFGWPEVIVLDDVPAPSAGNGEVLVRVAAAGVGPWDAIIREGQRKVSPQPPLTLGSDLSGVVEAIGSDVIGFTIGDEVYGVTNPQFCGAQAEYAVALAAMLPPRPYSPSHLEAASAPVIAVTAWQMLFEYALAKTDDLVMITGAAGHVGAYTVQLALQAGIQVVAVAAPGMKDCFAGSAWKSSSIPGLPWTCLRSTASLIWSAEPRFTERLRLLTNLFDSGQISARVGSVLPLSQARLAQEMLAGTAHKPGKIVLQ